MNKLTYTNYGTVQYFSDDGVFLECPVDVFEKMCRHPKILEYKYDTDYTLQCKKKMFKISFSEGVKLPEYKHLNGGFLIWKH